MSNKTKEPKEPKAPEVAGQKILLAEDDNDMRRFLVRALTKAGYEVVSFDNGKAAYDRLRRRAL